jgi:hypothetical protein
MPPPPALALAPALFLVSMIISCILYYDSGGDDDYHEYFDHYKQNYSDFCDDYPCDCYDGYGDYFIIIRTITTIRINIIILHSPYDPYFYFIPTLNKLMLFF